MTLQEQIAIADGLRFQKKLGEFIAEHKFEKIVETGAGVSSIYVLQALDEHQLDSKLFSIDPSPWYAHEITHPKFQLIKKKSIDAMLELFLKTGGWDMFTHDGEHDILAQTYEYEFAYACLNSGGIIASDDYTWGNHGAWQNFLASHDLKPFSIGAIQAAQKPIWVPVFDNIEMVHEQCLNLAKNKEEEWLLAGNKNSDVIWNTL